MQIPSTHFSVLSALLVEERREEAWAVFQARYQGVLLGWCRRRLSPEDADDLTQEVLLKLFEALSRGGYDPAKGRFRSLLKAVVNNAVRDCWRRRRRRPEPAAVGGSAFLERLGAMAAPESVEELSSAIKGKAQAILHELLQRVRARLKATTWEAFYLTAMEGRPPTEVAAALGLTIDAVYKAKKRGTEMLWEEYLYAHPTAAGAGALPGGARPPGVPR
jgi:RNA polymerase sigma-70 factor, ECF subfamily